MSNSTLRFQLPGRIGHHFNVNRANQVIANAKRRGLNAGAIQQPGFKRGAVLEVWGPKDKVEAFRQNLRYI